MESRVNLSQNSPELYQAVVNLDRLARDYSAAAGINQGFYHLLKLRASQLNQCAYCVRLHTKDALASGESIERISVLPAWRETQYFDGKERAALALIEATTLIADGQIEGRIYAEAVNVLSEQEVAAIEWLGIVINTWNRIAIASRYPVGTTG